MKLWAVAAIGAFGRGTMLIAIALGLGSINQAFGYAVIIGFGLHAVSGLLLETYVRQIKAELTAKMVGAAFDEVTKNPSNKLKDV